MDIILSLLNLSTEKYNFYIKEINGSNLTREVQSEIADLLKTALEQTKQAKMMGWLA